MSEPQNQTNTEEGQSELTAVVMPDWVLEDADRIKQGYIESIKLMMPKKSPAYVSYSERKSSFYVSTTEEDFYDGYITMEAIIDDFIEGYEQGNNGPLEAKPARELVAILECAIAKLKSREWA